MSGPFSPTEPETTVTHGEKMPAVTVDVSESGPGASTPGVEADARAPAARFEAIYDEHFDFVWRSLRRMGVPEASAEDAAQDVFLVVHRRLQDFEGRSSLRTWLFGIALRVARSHRRRIARKGKHEPLPADVVSDGELPEDTVQRRRAAAFLDQFLDGLDQDKRAVFVLAELEQMTAPEIEAALGVKLNTVYSRLRAARKAFEAAVARQRAKDARLSEQRGGTA